MPIRKLGRPADRKSQGDIAAASTPGAGGNDGGGESPPSDPNRNPDGSYIVGKGKTPVHTRWKKGQSGNAGNKRKAQPDLEDAVIALMEEPIVIPVGEGKTAKVTQAAALMRQTYVRAMKGDIRATKFLFEVYAKAKAGKANVAANDDALSDAEQEMLKALLGGFGAEPSEGDAP